MRSRKNVIKAVLRKRKNEVEKIRSFAASQKDPVKYYKWALLFWQSEPRDARMIACVRKAAALDGIQL